jgi:hypothetical protein
MKRFILRLVLIAALCNVIACAQDMPSWGEELLGRQLGLQVTVSQSDSIIAHVLLRNTTDSPIEFEGTGQRHDLEWSVSSGGREVPRRVPPEDRRERELWRMDEITSIRGIGIEPHASKEYSVDLRKLYDFLPNTEYVITAVFLFSGDKSTHWLRISRVTDFTELKSGNVIIRTPVGTNANSSAALPPRNAPEAVREAISDASAAATRKEIGQSRLEFSNRFIAPATVTPPAEPRPDGFTVVQKFAIVSIALLLAVIGFILLRARRRGREHAHLE